MPFSTSTPSVIVGAWSLRAQGCEGPHVPGRCTFRTAENQVRPSYQSAYSAEAVSTSKT